MANQRRSRIALNSQANAFQTANRIDSLESRLIDQERATQNLLDRAVKIQTDLVENLSYTRGTWQEEKEGRELLQDHVRTINSLVRAIDKQIKSIKGDSRTRQTDEQAQQGNIRKLEAHHVTALTDLKNRISRCDASINKLQQDLRHSRDRVQHQQSGQTNEYHQMIDNIQAVDAKMGDCMAKVDQIAAREASRRRETQDGLSSVTSQMELKVKNQLEDTRLKLNGFEVEMTTSQERMSARLQALIERDPAGMETNIERVTDRWNKTTENVNERFSGLEAEFKNQRDHLIKVNKDFDLRLNSYAQLVAKQQQDDINHIRDEMREGFATLHDTVLNMRTVIEGKQRLMEESVKRELSQLRRMVVLV